MKAHNKAFGQVIRDLRMGKKHSQEELAFISGYDRTYISRLELGNQSPTLDTIMVLCQSLDIDFIQLASRVDAIMKEVNQ